MLIECLDMFTELGAADGRIDSLYYLAENTLAAGSRERFRLCNPDGRRAERFRHRNQRKGGPAWQGVEAVR